MKTKSPSDLVITRRLQASPERVFDAWINPETALKWLSGGAHDDSSSAIIDARAGGKWILRTRNEAGESLEWGGEYLEVDRPRKLVLTFGFPLETPDKDRVVVELVPDGEGCRLTLTHANGGPGHDEGWTGFLDAVESAATEHDSRGVEMEPAPADTYGTVTAPDTIRFERFLPAPIERVWEYLTNPEMRGQWLASGTLDARPGGLATLRFDHAKLSPITEKIPEKYKQYEGASEFTCRVTQYEPSRKLGMTWGGASAEASEVIFELFSRPNGTSLVLTHRRLADREAILDVAGGWHTHLGILEARTSGKTPLPYWSAHLVFEAEYEKRIPATKKKRDTTVTGA